MSNYQQQLDSLFQSYLDVYCKPLKSIEFIISSNCDQKCEYCYLQKHKTEMNYHMANDKNTILNNLKLLLSYLDDNNFQYSTYDIFSGEFFALSYWEDIFNIFYEHQLNLNSPQRAMVIPSNFSFIADDVKTKKIESWIEKFNQVNCALHLSCSIDGPAAIENITRNNYTINKDEIFYDKLFTFLAKYHQTLHPMITKEFLKNYKENYDFLVDNIIKYNIKFNPHTFNSPMLLEVRDAEQWDEESLKNYKDFLYYIAKKDLEVFFNNDIEQFALKFFDDFSDGYIYLNKNIQRSQPYIIGYPSPNNNMPCSIQKNLAIRLGDLKVAPCHRTFYKEFEYGGFKVEDNKIVGTYGLNPLLAFKISTFNSTRSALKCSSCKYRTFCLKGCLGSQFETTKELFSPQEQVCKMFEIKYQTIQDIAEKYNLFSLILENPNIPIHRKEFITYVKKILQS